MEYGLPRSPLPLLAALAAACVLPSCAVDERSLTTSDSAGDATEPDVPRPPTTYADILFVVDNSGSMSQEQAALARGFPTFLETLFAEATRMGIDASVNVGVVSTDMGTMGYRVSTCDLPDGGDQGCLQNTPSPTMTGCSATYPSFLTRQLSFGDTYPVATMAVDLGCIGALGTDGCGFEQQFEAARTALIDNTASTRCNSGFIRPGSATAVIFVTDEEDCSVRPSHPEMFDQDRTDLGHLNIRCYLHPDFLKTVDEYLTALWGFAGEGHPVILAALVGVPPDAPACIGSGDELEGCLRVAGMQEQIDPAMPTQLVPACNTTMGLAFPARRFVRLAQAFGRDAFVGSICRESYDELLQQVAARVVELMQGG